VGSIAESLAAVLDDNELATRLGSAGRARSLAYSWSKTADSLVAVYQELLS